MTREESLQEILNIKNNNVLLQLPTSWGKSKCGIDLAFRDNPNSVLIVVPRIALINNWKEEFIKWHKESYLNKVTFSTYAGIHKTTANKYDVCIYDEGHHITERVLDLKPRAIKNIILSATINKDAKWILSHHFKNLHTYSIKLNQAIEYNVLPDPTIYLLPMELNPTLKNETIVVHPKGRNGVTCDYDKRWNYIKDKTRKVNVKCTQLQKYYELNKEIEYWKKRYMVTRNDAIKNKWLFLAGNRLKWLSSLKYSKLIHLLEYLEDERVLVFCNSIEQSEDLSTYCINSKNKNSIQYLEDFNKGKINHITAVNMLNEGMNLRNCRIGIWGVINSSEIMNIQKVGRILRHKSPILIIPYYKSTREAELVTKMLESYNKDLIITINNINEIKL